LQIDDIGASSRGELKLREPSFVSFIFALESSILFLRLGEIMNKINNGQEDHESTKENALIFDFDGTLIDSQSVILLNVQSVLSSFLKKEISLDEVKEKYHPDWKKLVSNFNVQVTSDNQGELISLWVKASMNNVELIKPFDHIESLLEMLSAKFDFYLWTGRDRQSCEYLLKKWNLSKYFKNISCGDDQVGTKPSLNSYKNLLSESYKTEIMVGDSLLDFYGAKEVQIPFVPVSWCDFCDLTSLQEVGVNNFINNEIEFVEVINKYL